eukprot:GEMP01092795.1.p1 GENE.GEMP01092795.1~~GEMP01092795.1.p1  ORF type:complete len:105 (+),score=0.86 GEMP01092795.1:473-787(+)
MGPTSLTRLLGGGGNVAGFLLFSLNWGVGYGARRFFSFFFNRDTHTAQHTQTDITTKICAFFLVLVLAMFARRHRCVFSCYVSEKRKGRCVCFLRQIKTDIFCL